MCLQYGLSRAVGKEQMNKGEKRKKWKGRKKEERWLANKKGKEMQGKAKQGEAGKNS